MDYCKLSKTYKSFLKPVYPVNEPSSCQNTKTFQVEAYRAVLEKARKYTQ